MTFKSTFSFLALIAGIFSVSQAQAVFQPGQLARPHTLCSEAGNLDAGLQIYITKINDKSMISKIEVVQNLGAKKEAIALRNSTVATNDSVSTYSGDGLLLLVSKVEINELGERPGHVAVTLQDGTILEKDLQCQPLFYILSAQETQ